jgi:hypothetical protein
MSEKSPSLALGELIKKGGFDKSKEYAKEIDRVVERIFGTLNECHFVISISALLYSMAVITTYNDLEKGVDSRQIILELFNEIYEEQMTRIR